MNSKIKDDDEANHFHSVIKSFMDYKDSTLKIHAKKVFDFNSLSPNDKFLLKSYSDKLDKTRNNILKNADFLNLIIKDEITPETLNQISSTLNLGKVRSTLRQFARDWSDSGKSERDSTYKPILNKLNDIFKDVPFLERHKLSILVPGAGLGRLAFEITTQGFSCQGNEFSYHMLLASNYILNKMSRPNEVEIFPWINTFSNSMSIQDNLAPISIPDVIPYLAAPNIDFSMSAGEFVEVYSKQEHFEEWDALVSCFFIDTAHNVIDYITTIYHLLIKGGKWINLGPLLWHYESMQDEVSIELCFEELHDLVIKMGFEVQVLERQESVYATNPNTMMKSVYSSVFFVATKL